MNGSLTNISSAEMECKINRQAEESNIEPLDGNDSDYSVTSLFGEAMQEISVIETESAESAKCPTEESGYFRTSSVACEETQTVIESNMVESNAMLPDGSDSDDSVVSLYKEVVGNKHSKASSACQKEKGLKSNEKQLCFICGILQRDLNNHMKMSHIKTKKFSCPHCPKGFVRKFEVLLHINTSHKKNITYSCEHCGKGFTNRNSHYYHVVNSHRKSALHECKICHRKLKSWDGYKKHLKTHSLTSHPCPDCDKLFKTTATLEKHKTLYHAS
ncbi:transcriptional repressor CTCF-like [Anopheles ziemanni]|nr:transcriptional repressor CTCF-like [Anopheles ziemanni]